MCLQKVGSVYLQVVLYGCNSITIRVNNVNYTLDKLLSYTDTSAILSNNVNTFELYTPGIDIEKLLKAFNCAGKVTLENILGGFTSIVNNINSNNSNSNNTNSSIGNTNTCNPLISNISDCEKREIIKQELETKEQLNRIEVGINERNLKDYHIHLLIFTICLIIIGIFIYMVLFNML